MCSSTDVTLRRVSRTVVAGYGFYLFVFNYLSNLDIGPLSLGVQARFWIQVRVSYVFLLVCCLSIWFLFLLTTTTAYWKEAITTTA